MERKFKHGDKVSLVTSGQVAVGTFDYYDKDGDAIVNWDAFSSTGYGIFPPNKRQKPEYLESQPSEQKPHKESKFTLSAAIENLDKLASIGKSLPSEQKPEVLFAGTNDINFDVHSGKGKQKITDHYKDVSKGATTLKAAKDQIAKKYGYSTWEEVNFYAVDAMSETTSSPYAEQALQDEVAELYASIHRNEAIQECIDIYKMNEWYDTILEKFEKLKSKTI